MSAKDKDREPGTFMIQACRMKALREMPDPNQVTVFDVLGDKEENTHEK